MTRDSLIQYQIVFFRNVAHILASKNTVEATCKDFQQTGMHQTKDLQLPQTKCTVASSNQRI